MHLAHCPLGPDDLEPLAHCAQLEQLYLEACMHIPASLSELRQLRVLRLHSTPQVRHERDGGPLAHLPACIPSRAAAVRMHLTAARACLHQQQQQQAKWT